MNEIKRMWYGYKNSHNNEKKKSHSLVYNSNVRWLKLWSGIKMWTLHSREVELFFISSLLHHKRFNANGWFVYLILPVHNLFYPKDWLEFANIENYQNRQRFVKWSDCFLCCHCCWFRCVNLFFLVGGILINFNLANEFTNL